MKIFVAIFACFLLLGLSGCGSSNDAQSQSTTNHPVQKTVFDGYVKAVDKAKQVQDKVDAARKKLDARVKQAESGGGK